MVIALALASALLFAVASVLQHHSARAEEAPPMRLAFLMSLATRPLWLAGIVADGLGYVAQFVALGRGSLVVVQPLLVSGLLFALPVGAAMAHKRLSRQDWVGAAAVVVGLSTFLVVAQPAPGRTSASGLAWVVVAAATCVPAALMVLMAGQGASPRRAILLAAATGTLYGFAAALTKTTAHLLAQGVVPLLASWQPYVLVACGVIGLVVGQSAFAAGSLSASLPTLSAVDPVVSVLIGAFGFDESLRTAGADPLLEVLGLALTLVGVVVLARSPLVTGERDPNEPSSA
ncbi:MAG: DMT family transporter [Acidimicrobiales bacterium]